MKEFLRKLLVIVLCAAFASSAMAVPEQRFHCRLSGISDQRSCCCQGEARCRQQAADAPTGNSCCATSNTLEQVNCRSRGQCESDPTDSHSSVTGTSNCCEVSVVMSASIRVVLTASQKVADQGRFGNDLAADQQAPGGICGFGLLHSPNLPDRQASPLTHPPFYILHCALLN